MRDINSKSFSKFLVLWGGELVSTIGSGLTAFALGVYVYGLTGTATSVALVTLLAFLPSVLLSPIAGVLADRFDRRLLMIIGDGCSALGIVLILINMWTGSTSLWPIYTGVTISSIFVSLLEPAYKATITDLLTEEQFAQASGLVQLAGSSKYLLSPVLAGLLLSYTSITTVLLIDICTFAVTIASIASVKKALPSSNKTTTNSFWLDLKYGWSALCSRKGVMQLVGLLSLVTFFLGTAQTLCVPMMLSITDATGLGIAESVGAIGMLVSSLLISARSIGGDYSKLMAKALAWAGLFLALIGATTRIPLITLSLFFFFAAIPFINTSAEVLIRKSIPNEEQGRAWGIIGIVSQIGYILAYALTGVLADRVFNPLLSEGSPWAGNFGRLFGVGPSRGMGLMFVLTGVMVVVVAIVAYRAKNIRSLDDLRPAMEVAHVL